MEVTANPRATGFNCVFFFFGIAKDSADQCGMSTRYGRYEKAERAAVTQRNFAVQL
jgi:hypothetical protein